VGEPERRSEDDIEAQQGVFGVQQEY
jgi:hypothetical protein